jgi:DNA (cytosine-5)-methyltransferase 1
MKGRFVSRKASAQSKLIDESKGVSLAQGTLFDLDEPLQDNVSWFEEMMSSLVLEEEPAWPDRFGKAIRKWVCEHKARPIRTLSLFSGGGGLDIAFHDAGFDIVQMIEVESRYVETLRANSRTGRLLEGAKVLCLDICDYEPDAGSTIDFIIGGPPCQTFSAAGRRASGVSGTSDPRGTLFSEYARILHRLQPAGFLFENVYGITGAQDGLAWKEIQEAFKSVGYSIHSRVLDAADYGVPQHRERLFIVGIREGEYQFPCPTHGPDSPGGHPFYNAGRAVLNADVSLAQQGLGGRFGHLLKDIPPGLNYSFYTKEMGHPSPVFSWRSKFSDFLYKADPDRPARTIKAQGGQYTGPFSWENRPFTIAELKRLQTIPDDYEIVGGRQAAIEQIGNSVPPQIGRMLALSILDQVMKIKLPFLLRYMPKEKTLGFRQRKRSLTEVYADKARDAIERLYGSGKLGEASKIIEGKKEAIRFLSRDFSLCETEKPGSAAIRLQYEFADSGWTIRGGRPEKTDSIKYEIVVTPSPGNTWCLGGREVRLEAMIIDASVFTALWKAFEEEINNTFGVADLVQLSGYYQYKPGMKAAMKFAEGVEADVQWRVIRMVVEGTGVGSQMTAQSLSLLWGIEKDEVLGNLKNLRAMGYEVRGHSTNAQIPEGEYLIPYIFPTLTPRSVQLRKKLSDEQT